jgi:hypothetical protein
LLRGFLTQLGYLQGVFRNIDANINWESDCHEALLSV